MRTILPCALVDDDEPADVFLKAVRVIFGHGLAVFTVRNYPPCDFIFTSMWHFLTYAFVVPNLAEPPPLVRFSGPWSGDTVMECWQIGMALAPAQTDIALRAGAAPERMEDERRGKMCERDRALEAKR